MVTSEASAILRRLERLRGHMVDGQIDLVLVAPSADLRYLSGYDAHASERPTLLVIRQSGNPVMVLPAFEAPRVAELEGFRVVTWEETQDPYEVLLDLIGSTSLQHIAISDQAWAAVLLGVQRVFAESSFSSASALLRQLRMVKSEDELDLLRRAGAKADAAFEHVVQLRFSGRTEREIARDLTAILVEEGLTTAEWGPIVGSGPNSASPHHSTGEREIHEGDAVLLDFGGTLQGYHADITRTVHVGTPSDEFCRVYAVVRQAQQAGIDVVGSGVAAQSIDAATRQTIQAAGYGDFFIHRTGHGIGLDGHEEPYIVAGNGLELMPAMTFSVEPGIYLPARFGVRIEDIVVVRENSAERLNRADRDLRIVH